MADCINIIAKRKWLAVCLTALITVISAIFILSRPAAYTATVFAKISSSRVYSTSAFGNNLVISSPPVERLFAAHVRLLKSGKILKRVSQAFKTQNADSKLTPEELSRKLKIKTLNSRRGELILEAQAGSPQKAVELVNIWAEQYQRYNEDVAAFCWENISLAYNEVQLTEYDQKLAELTKLQEAHEGFLREIQSKTARNQNQSNLLPAVVNINISLNEVRAQLSSLNELRRRLAEEIDRQKIKIDQLRAGIDSSGPATAALISERKTDEENRAYQRTLVMADDWLPGLFTFSGSAQKAQPPLLSKAGVLIGIMLFAGFFSALLACLPEICRGN